MLVISGVAESVTGDEVKNINKGSFYGFSLFSSNEQLDEQLTTIEDYMMERGWDNIHIEEQEILTDQSTINHDVLLEAIKVAEKEGLSGVFHNTPIEMPESKQAAASV